MPPHFRPTSATVHRSSGRIGYLFGGSAMSDFVAVVLVLVALAAVGNFASDGSVMNQGCTGKQSSWVRVCH